MEDSRSSGNAFLSPTRDLFEGPGGEKCTLETILATILVPGTACFVAPYLILRASGNPLNPPFGVVQFLSVLIAVLGLGMVVWVSAVFVRIGRGTPVPIHPPSRFVAAGLYRYVRNPMYVGALLIMLAWAAYFGSAWILLYAAGFWFVFTVFLTVFEEPQLRRRFGAEYEDYLKTVPRWVPRLWGKR
jgi:protein-S-isoprenylcysteine O-methyltransferase Ste14